MSDNNKIEILCEMVSRYDYVTKTCDIDGAIKSYEASLECHLENVKYDRRALKSLKEFKKRNE